MHIHRYRVTRVTERDNVSACKEEKAPLQQICVSLITQDPGHCKALHLHRSQHTEKASQIGAASSRRPLIIGKHSRIVKCQCLPSAHKLTPIQMLKGPFHCQHSHLLNTPTTTPPTCILGFRLWILWAHSDLHHSHADFTRKLNLLSFWNKKANDWEKRMKNNSGGNHELVRRSKGRESVGRKENRRGKERKTVIQDHTGH